MHPGLGIHSCSLHASHNVSGLSSVVPRCLHYMTADMPSSVHSTLHQNQVFASHSRHWSSRHLHMPTPDLSTNRLDGSHKLVPPKCVGVNRLHHILSQHPHCWCMWCPHCRLPQVCTSTKRYQNTKMVQPGCIAYASYSGLKLLQGPAWVCITGWNVFCALIPAAFQACRPKGTGVGIGT
jgi:hypothetical protein